MIRAIDEFLVLPAYGMDRPRKTVRGADDDFIPWPPAADDRITGDFSWPRFCFCQTPICGRTKQSGEENGTSLRQTFATIDPARRTLDVAWAHTAARSQIAELIRSG